MVKKKAEGKLETKPWKRVRLAGEGIVFPRASVEALFDAHSRGDRVAVTNIINELRELSEDQRPDVFRTHRHGHG